MTFEPNNPEHKAAHDYYIDNDVDVEFFGDFLAGWVACRNFPSCIENVDSVNTLPERVQKSAGSEHVASYRERVYEGLLLAALGQIKAWHSKYGQHGPSWLPPGGDLDLMQTIDDWLSTAPAKVTQTAQIPDGWKLVPVEPTKEMWEAVNKLDDLMAAGGYDGKGCSIEDAWHCLVDAAPAYKEQTNG